MKREREGGGNSPRQRRGWGPAPTRTEYPRRASPLPAEAARRGTAPEAAKVTPTGETNLGETNLGGPEVHRIVAKADIHTAHCDLLRSSVTCIQSVC